MSDVKKSLEWLTDWAGDSQRGIAKAINEDPSSFRRKVNNGISADLLIKIAEAYGKDPVKALHEAGILDGKKNPGIPLSERLHRLAREINELALEAQAAEMQAKITHIGANVLPDQDNDAHIIDLANRLPAAAQNSTEELIEPEDP